MKTCSSITATGAILALAVSTPLADRAQAHGYLMESFPPRHETVELPLSSVKLRFSVKADPNYSKLSIESEDGTIVASETLQEASHVFVMHPPPLNPGKYRVRYSILTPDGDRLQGAVEFKAEPKE